MAKISAFCLCLGAAAALLAAGSVQAQMVGGRALQSATPASATSATTATRPTNPYAVNGATQPDPFSIASPQGVAGATSSTLGPVSTMPASGAQAQAAQQPASYGGEGQPTAPPAYSIQSAPAGGPYSGPQPAPYPYNQLPQYQPQAAPPQQAAGTPQALAPAYNQIPSPYASMLAQPAPPQGGAPGPAQVPGMAAPQFIEGGYTLGPGDRVRITVFGEQDLSGEYQLDGNGNIRLPLVGVMRAAGFTAQALEIALYSALVPNYLRNPRLTIEITHYRPVYVVGAVIKPGQYDYVHDMTLLQAIALAGGFNNQAKESEVYVRREGETGEQLVPTAQPLLVRPGDTVRVDTTLFWDALNVFAPISGPAYLLK